MDEPFGYNCGYCGGSTLRCGVIHDFCVRCIKCKHCRISTCRCLECDISGHLENSCDGGLGCYQKEVFCIIPQKFKKYSDIGDSFYGTYNGFGYIKPETFSKNIFIDENLYDGRYIPVKIICKTCFLKIIAEEKEIIEMQNEIQNMSTEDKIMYQQFLNKENSIQNEEIEKLENYVTLDQIKFLFGK